MGETLFGRQRHGLHKLTAFSAQAYELHYPGGSGTSSRNLARLGRMQHQLFFAAMKRAPIVIRLLNSAEKDNCGF